MPAAHALHTVAEIREIETAALAALPVGTLMQRAGQAAAELALQLLSRAPSQAKVLALAGPGNNGGDALETAYLLAQAGAQVSVTHLPTHQSSKETQLALNRASSDKRITFLDPALVSQISPASWNLVIDGLFGIGLSRAITGTAQALVEAVNSLQCPILALDIPSGLDADTGTIVGDGAAVRATHTITFIADKPGLHTGFGRDHAGKVSVASIGIDENLPQAAAAYLNNVDAFSAYLRPRQHNSHKGSYGDVFILGGAPGMAGAPILAARAAAKCGAGRVFATFLDAPPAYDTAQPELMCRLAGDVDFSTGTVVAGPGLGLSQIAQDILSRVLSTTAPLILDADALNLIAATPELQQKLTARPSPAVITPHPLEAARLLQTTASTIQADRLAAARQLARRFNSIAILKGSGSIIAAPTGQVMINPTGGPALATAGTGDVLAGICGALRAQSFPAWETALAATWLHGRAGDVLTDLHGGPVGLAASELIPSIRSILNQLTSGHHHEVSSTVPPK